MDHFQYQNGALCAEDVPIAEIAAQVGTPFYCYSTATFTRPTATASMAARRVSRAVIQPFS